VWNAQSKYAQTFLGAFAFRFNHGFGLRKMIAKLIGDVARTKPTAKGEVVPDDWLLHNRRALLFGRDVLKAVMAAFTPGSQAA